MLTAEDYAYDFMSGQSRTTLQAQIIWKQKYAGQEISSEGSIVNCRMADSRIWITVLKEINDALVIFNVQVPHSEAASAFSLNKGDRVLVRGFIDPTDEYYLKGDGLIFLLKGATLKRLPD